MQPRSPPDAPYFGRDTEQLERLESWRLVLRERVNVLGQVQLHLPQRQRIGASARIALSCRAASVMQPSTARLAVAPIESASIALTSATTRSCGTPSLAATRRRPPARAGLVDRPGSQVPARTTGCAHSSPAPAVAVSCTAGSRTSPRGPSSARRARSKASHQAGATAFGYSAV